MSLHTKKEFRALCGGMTVQFLSIYVSRGAIELTKDEYIDDSNPKNHKVLRKFQLKNGGAISLSDLESIDFAVRKGVKVISKPNKESELPSELIRPSIENTIEEKKEVKPRYTAKTIDEITDKKIAPEFLASNDYMSDDSQKKKLEILKLEKDVELKELEIMKKKGILIPVSLVEGVFSRHSASFVNSFKMTLDVLVDEYSHKYSLSRADVASFRGRMVEEINIAIKEALRITELEINNIINETKIVR